MPIETAAAPITGPFAFLGGFIGSLFGGRGQSWREYLAERGPLPVPEVFQPTTPAPATPTPPITGGPEAPRTVTKQQSYPSQIITKVKATKKTIEQWLDANPEARDALLGVAAYYAGSSGRNAVLYRTGRSPTTGGRTSQRGGLPKVQPKPRPIPRPRRTPRQPGPSRRARPQRAPTKLPPARKPNPMPLPQIEPPPMPSTRPAPKPAPQRSPQPAPQPGRTTSPAPSRAPASRRSSLPAPATVPAPGPVVAPLPRFAAPAIRMPFLPSLPSFSIPTGLPVKKLSQAARQATRTASQIGTLLLPADQPWAMPQVAYDYDRDDCSCEKPKRKPRQPRTVCYEGTYTERSLGINKRKRKQVPCQ